MLNSQQICSKCEKKILVLVIDRTEYELETVPLRTVKLDQVPHALHLTGKIVTTYPSHHCIPPEPAIPEYEVSEPVEESG